MSNSANQYIGLVEFINSGVYELISKIRRVCWFYLQTTLLTSHKFVNKNHEIWKCRKNTLDTKSFWFSL